MIPELFAAWFALSSPVNHVVDDFYAGIVGLQAPDSENAIVVDEQTGLSTLSMTVREDDEGSIHHFQGDRTPHWMRGSQKPRVEFRLPVPDTDNVTYGGMFSVPDSWVYNNALIIITQWHNKGRGIPLSLGIRGGTLALIQSRSSGPSTTIAEWPYKRGQWYDIHLSISWDEEQGRISGSIGSQTIEFQGPTQTYPRAGTPYWKIGIYQTGRWPDDVESLSVSWVPYYRQEEAP